MKNKEQEALFASLAKKAWDLDIMFRGDLSGGIEPVKNMIGCRVSGGTVLIDYDLPETCGLSDVRYHVKDCGVVRTDEFRFGNGMIFMNGKPFPGEYYETDPWTRDAALNFKKEVLCLLESK